MSDAALVNTELALNHVKTHLASTESRTPEIEICLVSYLAVQFYSEMEDSVSGIFKARLHFHGDKKLEHFVSATHENMLKRVNKSDVAKMTKRFGQNCQDTFNSSLSEKDIADYSNIINGRHRVAHGNNASSQLSINQIELGLKAASSILHSLSQAIR